MFSERSIYFLQSMIRTDVGMGVDEKARRQCANYMGATLYCTRSLSRQTYDISLFNGSVLFLRPPFPTVNQRSEFKKASVIDDG
jgi:hypothetical protein